MYQSMVIKGTAEWVDVHKPNDMSKKYQVDICQLDKATVKMLKDVGLNVRKEDSEKKKMKGHFIVANTKRLPKVMDAAKNIWPSDIKIGNGSTVKCSVVPYDWVYKTKSGTSLSLKSLMVIDFKEDTGNQDGDEDLEAEEDGFVLENLEVEDIPFDDDGDDL